MPKTTARTPKAQATRRAARTATPNTSTPTPQDLHLRALLALIDGQEEADDTQQFIDAARRILAQPTPFNGVAGTLSVHECVMEHNRQRWDRGADSEYDRRRAVAVRELEDAGPSLPTSTSEELSGVLTLSIGEAQMIGAALMFLILANGGAR